MSYDDEIYKAAKGYIARGWKIFPTHTIVEGSCTCRSHKTCQSPGKHPRISGGFLNASDRPEDIERWFGIESEPSGIGVATGEVSGITVFDVDIGDGKVGAESWKKLLGDNGEPDTLKAVTGGGGFHVVFAYNSVLPTKSNYRGLNIDVRNDSGYIVVAPSAHISGKQYHWLDETKKIQPVPAYLVTMKIAEDTKTLRKDGNRTSYSLEAVKTMLDCIKHCSRQDWRNVGIILGREFNQDIVAYKLYEAWTNSDPSPKPANNVQTMNEAFYKLTIEGQEPANKLTMGTLIHLAKANGWVPRVGMVPIERLCYVFEGNNFIYQPTNARWTKEAVDAAASPVNEDGKVIEPSAWLKKNRAVTSMTCDPELEEGFVPGLESKEGSLVDDESAAVYNIYRKATIILGDPEKAGPFVDHVHKVFDKKGAGTSDADQFLNYMAHRVQRPADKPRFALLICGEEGCGKDTAIDFCVPAIGPWNMANITPQMMVDSFNEFLTKTIIRISETASQKDISKWAFYNSVKVVISGAPDYVVINPKYGQKFGTNMHCGVILTSNHLLEGVFIPHGCRRYDVIQAASFADMKLESKADRKVYFDNLWAWFHAGGAEHVAAYLHNRDISKFSPATGQRETAAFRMAVAGSMAPDHWLIDILDDLGWPDGVRYDALMAKARAVGETEADVRRKMSFTLFRNGYEACMNPTSVDGRWKFSRKATTVYIKKGVVGFDPIKELSVDGF